MALPALQKARSSAAAGSGHARIRKTTSAARGFERRPLALTHGEGGASEHAGLPAQSAAKGSGSMQQRILHAGPTTAGCGVATLQFATCVGLDCRPGMRGRGPGNLNASNDESSRSYAENILQSRLKIAISGHFPGQVLGKRPGTFLGSFSNTWENHTVPRNLIGAGTFRATSRAIARTDAEKCVGNLDRNYRELWAQFC